MLNDYTMLQKENRLRMKCLNAENKNILNRIVLYMESTRLNPYDNAVLQKELISMALEAEERNQLFTDLLGMSEKEFCDDLAITGRKTTFMDRVAFYLPSLLRIFLVLYLIKGALLILGGNLFTATRTISIQYFVVILFWLLGFLYFGNHVWSAKSTYFMEYKRYLFKGISFGVLVGTYLLLVFILMQIPVKSYHIPWILFFLCWLAFWQLSEWYQKKYASRLAKENPWRD